MTDEPAAASPVDPERERLQPPGDPGWEPHRPLTEPGSERYGPSTDPLPHDAAEADANGVRAAADAEQSPPRRPGDAVGKSRLGVPPRIAARLELPLLILFAVAIAVLVKSFVVQPFYIPSASMETTLHGCPGCRGDRILVFKPVYDMRDPHPGDVVVFASPDAWPEASDGGGTVLSSNPVVHAAQWVGQLVGIVAPSEHDLVKRVIAAGGQTVKCCDAVGNVQVADDGVHFRSLSEPYVFENDSRVFGPVLVPAGRLWVMGDHRNDSADSRYHCVPNVESADLPPGASCDPVSSTVATGDVIGKAVAIAWPPGRWRTLGTPATFSALGLPGPVAAVTQPSALVFVGVGLVGGRRRWRRSASHTRQLLSGAWHWLLERLTKLPHR